MWRVVRTAQGFWPDRGAGSRAREPGRLGEAGAAALGRAEAWTAAGAAAAVDEVTPGEREEHVTAVGDEGVDRGGRAGGGNFVGEGEPVRPGGRSRGPAEQRPQDEVYGQRSLWACTARFPAMPAAFSSTVVGARKSRIPAALSQDSRRGADLARLNVRPRRPDRSAAHRHERAADRAVTVTSGCNCRRILWAADRREVKSAVGGVAGRRQRACDERPEPGFRVDESVLAQRPVYLLPGRRGDPELGLELEHRRHAGARRVGAVRDPLPDHFGDLAPPWLVRSKFDHLAKLGSP